MHPCYISWFNSCVYLRFISNVQTSIPLSYAASGADSKQRRFNIIPSPCFYLTDRSLHPDQLVLCHLHSLFCIQLCPIHPILQKRGQCLCSSLSRMCMKMHQIDKVNYGLILDSNCQEIQTASHVQNDTKGIAQY